MCHRSPSTAMAAVVAVALFSAGCTSPATTDDPTSPTSTSETDTGSPTQTPTTPVPEPSPTDTGSPDDGDVVTGQAAIFYSRASEDRIHVEPVKVPIEASRGDDGLGFERQVIQTLFGTGPTDPALSTSAPPVDVRSVAGEAGVLVVDVDGAVRGASGGSAQELAFAQQLAHTANGLGFGAVRLLVDGDAITELWGHLDWSQAVEPDPFDLSPITIGVPAHGQSVPVGSVVVRGEATVFEATFGLRLLDAQGDVVDQGFVMASRGAPERGTWTHTFTIDAPGAYTIEATEDDPSGGEGRPPFVTTRELEVEAAAS